MPEEVTANERPCVLAVDDLPAHLRLMEALLADMGIRTVSCGSGSEMSEALGLHRFDCVLLDLFLKNEDGLKLLSDLRQSHPALPVIIITGQGSVEAAVEAMRVGAYDFLCKPLETTRLRVAVRNAIERRRLTRRIERLEQDDGGVVQWQGMVGVADRMRAVFRNIESVAATDVGVMVLGESGTGKELVANAIHRLSRRSGGSFVPVNMAALPGHLVESILFGHRRGAFTGAVGDQQGCCEMADKGTLFLDEIGDMPIDLQAKLLRFLETHSVQRVGESMPRAVDVRVIAATHRDPMAAVRAGRFREDLFYRLNVVPIELPALRERRDDIPLLATHFLRRFGRHCSIKFEEIDPPAMDALCAHSWPGNVRELEHAIERAVVLHSGPRLTLDMLPREVRAVPHAKPRSGATEDILPLETVERQAIEDALARCDGNVGLAAKKLGIGQATLYRKIKQFNKSIPSGAALS